MFENSGIYDPGPIKPVVQIKENISVYTRSRWEHYRVDYIEPMPRSTPMVVEMVVASGATSLVANGTIAKRVVAILQLNTLEFLHLRWEPLDNVQGVLWETAGNARYNARSVQAFVDRNTAKYDPYLATTTFWIMGIDRDMNLEARNPMGYATPVARFAFWGYRYILSELVVDQAYRAAVAQGDVDAVRKTIGATTWLPAEGRAG